MSEYLAPGVYVEEVSSGNKPIQAASTSTAGMVGLAARGPVNIPTLITSLGQANRVFGGMLDHHVYGADLDALPYALEGFFKNGGARVYVTRVVGDDASRAQTSVYSQDMAGAATFALVAGVASGATTLTVDDDPNDDIANGVTLLIAANGKSDLVTIDTISKSGLLLERGLDSAVAGAATVDVYAIDSQIPSASLVQLDDGQPLPDVTAWGVSVGDTLLIENTDNAAQNEFVTLADDGGTMVIAENGGLFEYQHLITNTQISVVSAATPATLTVGSGAAVGDSTVLISSAVAGDEVLIRIGDGSFYHVSGYTNDLTLEAGETFVNAYAADTTATLVGAATFEAYGIYEGSWADDLRLSSMARNTLTTTVAAAAATTDTDISLNSVFGVEQGSYLQFTTSGGSKISRKVAAVDRSEMTVTLTATIGTALAEDDAVVSLEFDLIVERLDGDTVVQSERFDNLALDPAHSNYALTLVGSYDSATQTISSSGASELVRLGSYVNGSMPLHGAYFALDDGDDDLASVDDATFIGNASDDPDKRTGIAAMINENDISIVAVPGQTSVTLQKALLAHCEQMRYRFAVLDSEKGAKLAAVQKHRQNYDTTYGAFYYPWLTIADPFGVKGDEINIAPSGHMLGVYARTDVQRGVHKAPANEVVKSILSFETRLTKGEQDVLNPGHINCFRDFRDVNRGLRIFGARTLSSNPEWRYINVRRLFLFLEKSVDSSMQWATFEPNAEPLWATVKRSLVNFLNTVWRSGALEGVTQDEAFYVNVGLDTMSQTDIDNGRLIVEIGVAPTKPAEFVIFRFSQKTREAQG